MALNNIAGNVPVYSKVVGSAVRLQELQETDGQTKKAIELFELGRAYLADGQTKMAIELFEHVARLRQNLEECLMPLVADDNEVETLLADPTGPRWSAPELEEKLEKRLSRLAYEQYKQTIAGMTQHGPPTTASFVRLEILRLNARSRPSTASSASDRGMIDTATCFSGARRQEIRVAYRLQRPGA
ncbi:hypothetical protein K469DRAFT_686008 [Zopfia rhizophila CBS 207.26]|uniref:Uncharacterized protein n=1 Tax=Zopfia rhizophila CBS 207.26 TaxID=1314779 RepID=A0A6A6D5H0_9PEZI|nr:hypothetical protein K469DRAFT_686008 [Zopfia rhizophila CBS 207.26]